MSLSSRLKQELLVRQINGVCCIKAELAAIFQACGYLHLKDKEVLSSHLEFSYPALARRTLRLLAPFKMQTGLLVKEAKVHRSYHIFFPPQPRLWQFFNELGVLEAWYGESFFPPRVIKKSCCAASFLRGAFLARGSMSLGKHGYHFEIRSEGKGLIEAVLRVLKKWGLDANVIEFLGENVLYLKGSAAIEKVLARLGAKKVLFELEEKMVIKELRSQVNRQVNCTTANVKKVVRAVASQVEDIELLESEVGLENLPPALREVAALRKKWPLLSVTELGLKRQLPLSKSAVYHRLRRIHQLAQKLEREGWQCQLG